MCVFSLIEEGGDWDRRNRLKVYLGLYSVMMRDFKTAAAQFLDTVATFTSYELMDYETFVIYTIFSTVVAMSRTDLRDKVSRLFINQRFSSIFKLIFFKGLKECRDFGGATRPATNQKLFILYL